MTNSPAEIPPLDPCLVLLVVVHLDMARPLLDELHACLSQDELERASRFAFEKDRQRFVLSRAVLRWTLGHYLGRKAQEIVFDYAPYGKPSVNAPSNESPISFNLAHSHNFTIIGLASGVAVGVDVEVIRQNVITEGLIRAVLSPRERAQFAAMPAQFQAEAFYRLWTRKEAFLKATGSGHAVPMVQLDFGLAQEESDEVDRISTRPGEEWSITSFSPHPGYAASAVAKGSGNTFSVLPWNPRWYHR